MLTDKQIQSFKPAEKGSYKKFDANGLYIEVYGNGSKQWRLKYRKANPDNPSKLKEDRLVLGQYPEVSLKDARQLQAQAKLLLSDGIDPKEQQRQQTKQQEQETALSFKNVAKQWHDHRKADTEKWSALHAQKTWERLENHIFPILRNQSVKDIKPLDILKLVKVIEQQGKLDTARRVLDIIRQIFIYAVRFEFCIYNPASDLSRELKTHVSKHLPTITDPQEIGKLLVKIERWQGAPQVRTLLKLSPLVFTRPSEVRTMRWCEIDFKTALWTKQAKDMKNGIAHVVPLSKQAIALIKDLTPITGRFEYVFTNQSLNKPYTEGASRKALKQMGYEGIFSPHGWRHCASTLLHSLGYRTEWIEAQLAHKDPNSIRATYNHANYLVDRTEMMQDWSNYLDKLKAQEWKQEKAIS